MNDEFINEKKDEDEKVLESSFQNFLFFYKKKSNTT